MHDVACNLAALYANLLNFSTPHKMPQTWAYRLRLRKGHVRSYIIVYVYRHTDRASVSAKMAFITSIKLPKYPFGSFLWSPLAMSYVSSSSSSSIILFGIVYEKQNVQTLKQARLTSSKTKGNNKIILRLYHVQACRSFP